MAKKQLETADPTVSTETFITDTIVLYGYLKEVFWGTQAWKYGKKFAQNKNGQTCVLTIHTSLV